MPHDGTRGEALIDGALARLQHVAPAERSNPTVLVPALVDALGDYLFTDPAGQAWLAELAPGTFPRSSPLAEGRDDMIEALHDALVETASAPDAPPAFADCIEGSVVAVFGARGPGRAWSTAAVPASPFAAPAPLDLPRPRRHTDNPIGDLTFPVGWDDLPHPAKTITCHLTFADSCAYEGRAYPHQAELDRLVAEGRLRDHETDEESSSTAGASRGAAIGHGF